MKILKNYLYNISYQLFALIVPLITTPYIARVLGTSGVGTNAFTNSVVQYFVLFGGVGISMYGNRLVAYERKNSKKLSNDFWSLIVLRAGMVTGAYALFMGFVLLTSKYKVYYMWQSVQIIAVAFDISWLFMGLEDFKKTVTRNFIVKLLSTTAIFLFVHNESDLSTYIFILTMSILIGNLTLWPYLGGILLPIKLSELKFKKHFVGSFRLFIPQIAMQVYLVLNKTMLGKLDGVVSSGLYENSDRLVKILVTVVTAVVTVMLPRMANMFAQKKFSKLNDYLVRTLRFVTFSGSILAAGLAGAAPKFSVWFMGQSFERTGALISVLCLVVVPICWSTVLGTQYLVPIGHEKQFTISVSIGALCNVLINLPLILLWGTMGAVIATVTSELFITVIDLWFVRNEVKISSLVTDNWKYLVAGLFTFILVRFINGKMPGEFVYFIIQGLLGLLCYLVVCSCLKAKIFEEIQRILFAPK